MYGLPIEIKWYPLYVFVVGAYLDEYGERVGSWHSYVVYPSANTAYRREQTPGPLP